MLGKRIGFPFEEQDSQLSIKYFYPLHLRCFAWITINNTIIPPNSPIFLYSNPCNFAKKNAI